MPLRTVYTVPFRSSVSYSMGLAPDTATLKYYTETVTFNSMGTLWYEGRLQCQHIDRHGRWIKTVLIHKASSCRSRSTAARRAKERLNYYLSDKPSDSITETRENIPNSAK